MYVSTCGRLSGISTLLDERELAIIEVAVVGLHFVKTLIFVQLIKPSNLSMRCPEYEIRLVVPDTGFLHDRTPTFGFFTNEGGEFRAGRGDREQPSGIGFCLNGGIGQDLRHFAL